MPADALAARAGRALLARSARLAVAESCTGGLVGGRITGVPGSSRYLLGGVVAYHNTAKVALLRVPRRMLARFGAVSAPVKHNRHKAVTGATRLVYHFNVVRDGGQERAGRETSRPGWCQRGMGACAAEEMRR